MRLAVLGSLRAAVVNAAWAAANAGSEVVYISAKDRAACTQVAWRDGVRSAQLTVQPPTAQIEADAFVIIAGREETVGLAETHATDMRGRPVLLAPGGFAVVEAVDGILNTDGAAYSPVGQLPGFPVIGDDTEAGVNIRSVKRNFPVGALCEQDTPMLLDVFARWFPDLVGSTLIETLLSNTNNLLHAPIMLVNLARSDMAEPYLFYKEGMSTVAARMITAIDLERLEMLRALHQEQVPFARWIERYYGDQGLMSGSLDTMISSLPALSGTPGPASIQTRYISEDVAYGLAPMEEIGRKLAVATPVLSSLITMLSTACGSDLREHAARLIQESKISQQLSTV